MKFATAGAPHVPAPKSVHWVMLQVLLALIPGTAAYVWFFGPGILVQITLAVAAAVAFEVLMLRLRRQPVSPFLNDLSAPVTAVLYALCLPPLMPWWTVVIGMGFAIVVAKHLYGGLGFNVFNPAMVGYVVVLIAFPREATSWLPPEMLAEHTISFGAALMAIFTGELPAPLTWDAVTQATPLDVIRTGATQDIMISEIRSNPLFGDFGGKGWEWIANFYLLGGLYLLFRRVITWHVPVAVMGVVIVMTLPVYLFDPGTNPFPLQHIFSGGIVLGACFVATDPVSGAASPLGRLVFGGGVAVFTLMIRRWGGYPDGFAFAILMMNMAVPLIDRYTRPRVFGQ
ncbi:MAG: RnfABCDGE type electron transport complex subunit D [Xanthomonadales bacterium]|nr:RnfABCDGE type electron transport complex subunit D [Xanthomonadales bacterium]